MLVQARNEFLNCETREDLARFLDIKKSTLTFFAYGPGKKYKIFEIPKKSGGTRKIAAPIEGLKEIQKKLSAALNNIYSNPPDSAHGFVIGRSIISNAEPHLRRRLILNLDLQDFFPTIAGYRVYGLFRAEPFNFSKEVASTLAAICSVDNKVPQGAPTSPVISNLICFRLDRALTAFAAQQRITYTRYADDITFSTTKSSFSREVIENPDSDTPVLGEDLIKIIQGNGFIVNPKKTRLDFKSEAKYVTGVKVNSKLNVPRKFVRQIRAMVNDWEKRGLTAAKSTHNARYNLSNKEKDFVTVLGGKLSHLKNVKGHTDLTYRRLYNRFALQEGKGRPTLPLEEIEELRGKVLVIESGSKIGTGFVLNEKFLVTCRHTVEVEGDDQFPRRTNNEVKFFTFNDFPEPSKKRASINPAYSSHTADLIFIDVSPIDKTSEKSLYAVNLSAGLEIAAPNKYKVVGFPIYLPGMAPHITPLAVTAVHPNQYGVQEVYVDKKMVGGMSGGPVLNENNQVVGMALRGTSSRATGDDSVGYLFLPIAEILRSATSMGIAI